MECPECGTWGFRVTCKKCKYSTAKPKNDKYPTITGRTDTIVSRQCEFQTGAYRCQWGIYASDQEKKPVYCWFHWGFFQVIDRHPAMNTTKGQFEEFLKEHEWNQANRHKHSWAHADGTIPKTPFWFQPAETCWKMLTGLPVPQISQAQPTEPGQKTQV